MGLRHTGSTVFIRYGNTSNLLALLLLCTGGVLESYVVVMLLWETQQKAPAQFNKNLSEWNGTNERAVGNEILDLSLRRRGEGRHEGRCCSAVTGLTEYLQLVTFIMYTKTTRRKPTELI